MYLVQLRLYIVLSCLLFLIFILFLVRYSLLYFHLSQMAVHDLHHLHYPHLHILLHVQSFILNLRLGSSANPILHRPFSFPTGLIPRILGPFNVFTALHGMQSQYSGENSVCLSVRQTREL